MEGNSYEIIAIFILLLTVSAGFAGCNSRSQSKVFEMYTSIEFDMEYEDLVKLLGDEFEKNDYTYSTDYIWEWSTSDIYESISISFEDGKLYSKFYYRAGDIYRGITASDYEMWESLKVGIELDAFIESYGKYVTMTSHSVYNSSSDMNEYSSYEGVIEDGGMNLIFKTAF